MAPPRFHVPWLAVTTQSYWCQRPHSLTRTRPKIPPSRSPQPRFFTDLTPPLQILLSTTTDPYINLSAEHYLLQNSPADSTILLLYRNAPCVVIGRNQNPWVEVNLQSLRRGVPASPSSPRRNRPVALVRRRSGGGTVFHDEGNVNWSVISPSATFSRTAHAEMVVRALTEVGVSGVRVNERHDIVMDVPQDSSAPKTFKVSGSAYKLTRVRSLHHGTCLLDSWNLDRIGPLLRSPAEKYVKARGVESVRSPVRNVGIGTEEFEESVVRAFRRMYLGEHSDGMAEGSEVPVKRFGEEVLETREVEKGFRELTSPEWIFGQTPQFTFSTHPLEDDPRSRPPPPEGVSPDFKATLTVRHGQIQEADITGLQYLEDPVDKESQDRAVSQALVGLHLHQITDWAYTLRAASPVPLGEETERAGGWLDDIFAAKVPA